MTEDRAPQPTGRRARRLAETRRRIVEAAVDLHTSVGPANTSISAVAEHAGVQRHTVYAHFPDQRVLFRECAALWEQRNPFPDVRRWAAIGDPGERLAVALDELYAFYARNASDLATVFAGAHRVPEMTEALARRSATGEAIVEILARGRGVRSRRRARLRAAIRHATTLETWRSLAVEGGLDRRDAVRLMCALADAACAAEAPAPSRADPAGLDIGGSSR